MAERPPVKRLVPGSSPGGAACTKSSERRGYFLFSNIKDQWGRVPPLMKDALTVYWLSIIFAALLGGLASRAVPSRSIRVNENTANSYLPLSRKRK